MKLYWCRDFRDKGESHELLKLALEDYMKNMPAADEKMDKANNFENLGKWDRLDKLKEVKILKGAHGKPYTSIPGVYFNISHSQNLWVCGVSSRPLGVDVEIVRQRDYQKLVDKYFKPDEVLYVKERGLAGFFDIWTWKEAHSKLLGESIFKNLGISAVSNGKIKSCSIQQSTGLNDELARAFNRGELAKTAMAFDSGLKQICIRYKLWDQFNEAINASLDDQICCTVAKAVLDLSENICVELREIELD